MGEALKELPVVADSRLCDLAVGTLSLGGGREAGEPVLPSLLRQSDSRGGWMTM